MEDIKKIQEFFSKPLEENMSLDDQAKAYYLAKVKSGEIDTLPENPKAAFLAQMTKDQMGHDKETLRRERGLEEGKQLDIIDLAKVVQAVHQTGHPVTVLLTPKFNEIEVLTGMNAPDDMLRDLSNAVDSLGYGRNDIIIAGDSSNLSRREYSDIRRVNGGHKDYFEESVNEASRARVSMPRFVKDKNNPNFLNVYIDYDLGPGGSPIAFGKETMTGQIRRESAAEAMRLAGDVARDLEAEYNLEDIDIQDLKNGKVRIFAVSDDFINMNPNMLGEIKESLNPEVSNAVRRFIKAMAKRYDYSEQDAVYAIMAALKQRDFDGLEEAKVEVDDTTQFKLDLKHLLDKHIVKEASKEEENEFHKELDKLVHKTFGHSSDEKKKSVAQELAETIKLGEGVIEEELCPKGKAYIKRRQAAGEKSSAYLSGRAVKVCKGQMSGRAKKK